MQVQTHPLFSALLQFTAHSVTREGPSDSEMMKGWEEREGGGEGNRQGKGVVGREKN